MLKESVLFVIKTYQKTFSPDHGILSFWLKRGLSVNRVCRFYPTWSEYAYEAVERLGVKKGLVLAVKRLSRCHPFNAGGYDPVK